MDKFIFPQYRSLEGFNRHYMILNGNEFVEASLRNNSWEFQTIVAEQYPEKLRIQDMLNEAFSYKKATPETERLFENCL